MDDKTKIGIGLTFFGVVFTLLGVMFFFDQGLLTLGNLLFLSGVTLTIGTKRTLKFFVKRQKNYKGTAFFFGGFAMVLYGWAIIGMCLESYGFVLLFSDFFPTVIMFLKRIPVFGNILNLPGVKTVVNKLAPKGTLPI
mmetsp:Transcript_33868/g.40956  ORF Transcript_33868/g.40956 Transcript_33868/m.40956 type:complete len:138 (-) Transcript_33868:995-1408(-)|eukprot:CAMPEP_0197846936 /NCGR_PEP_ID=MMETSP1438-20131217/4728_1 /TAXON_ID=1461541 /ORGANISM="Pterosperma sp., Strain CCMP1384" /LENGTH=137 /DNA_ID=CAMNT_0043458727 /DNA_START=223 /DNA_END=636 /DNA_ORIENTATION=+